MKLKLIKKDGVKHITVVEEPKQYIEFDVTYLWDEDIINVTEEGLEFKIADLLSVEEKERFDYDYPEVAYLKPEELKELSQFWPFDEEEGASQERVEWFIGDNMFKLFLEQDNIQQVFEAWKGLMMDKDEMESIENDFQEDIMDSLRDFRREIKEDPSANWEDYEDICQWVDRELLRLGTEMQRRMSNMSNRW